MSFIIELDRSQIEDYLTSKKYDEIEAILKTEFALIEDATTGQKRLNKPTHASIPVIATIIENLKENLESNQDTETSVNLLRQCYISLRNTVAIHKSIQTLISKEEDDIIDMTESLISILQENESESYQKCFIMLLQFLGNLVVDNHATQFIVWNTCHPHLLQLFQPAPTRIPSIVGMILYNIYLENKHLIPRTTEFVDNVIELYETEVDYAQLILELIIKTEIISGVYRTLQIKNRLIILELAHDMLPNEILIPEKYIQLLADDFKLKSDCILKTVTDYMKEVEPMEVVRLLDVIATASSIDKYRTKLQSDKSLFINSVFLLKSIHSAGKESDNNFTAIQKLSELTLNDSDVKDHPGFGFKAALIRLLGNLCWQCEENQDSLRELEGIPLLLDCCNMDARNPFIIQCVVLAIRGVCEGNLKNQSVIAGMTKVGTIDSATLTQMGLVLDGECENKISFMPYDKK